MLRKIILPRLYAPQLPSYNSTPHAEALEITAVVVGSLSLTVLMLAGVFYLLQRSKRSSNRNLEGSTVRSKAALNTHNSTIQYPDTKSLPLLPPYVHKVRRGHRSPSLLRRTPEWLTRPSALPAPLNLPCQAVVADTVSPLYSSYPVEAQRPSILAGNSSSIYSDIERGASTSTLFEENLVATGLGLPKASTIESIAHSRYTQEGTQASPKARRLSAAYAD